MEITKETESSSILDTSNDNSQKIPKQGKISSFLSKRVSDLQKQRLDEQLLRVVVKNIVESIEFVHLLNPRYQLPSRLYQMNCWIQHKYIQLRKNVERALEQQQYICTISDRWTSSNNDNYFAITTQFINKDCILKSRLTGSMKFLLKYSSENIANEILKELKCWQK